MRRNCYQNNILRGVSIMSSYARVEENCVWIVEDQPVGQISQICGLNSSEINNMIILSVRQLNLFASKNTFVPSLASLLTFAQERIYCSHSTCSRFRFFIIHWFCSISVINSERNENFLLRFSFLETHDCSWEELAWRGCSDDFLLNGIHSPDSSFSNQYTQILKN